MNYIKFLLILFVLVFAYGQIYAQFDNPKMGIGVAAGGAIGDNSSADKWVPQFRGYFQYQIIPHYLIGQVGVGYAKIKASGVYTAETGMADNRFLLIPFSLEKLNPYLYGGFGVSKDIGVSGSDFLMMVPVGVGIQTKLGSQMILDLSGGYHLSLSDKFDGLTRSDSKLNSFTNQKQDGYFGFLVGLTFSIGSNKDADSDKDGLTNANEKEIGTDPKKPDTDGDGLSDGVEVTTYKTDPLKVDTDGDGLSDGDEVNVYRTNPHKTDTDGDGLSDGDEVNKHKTEPLEADSDSDGLSDGAEVNQYKTNPLEVDSDGDGLSDGDEVNKYKTDPLKADSDSDGLSDSDEINKYKTDPLKIDTDNGGLNDGAEVKAGTNPADSKDDITSTIKLEKGKKVILHGVNFETSKATLTLNSENILNEAYKALISNPDVQVEISGHTDSQGSDELNQDLSLRRAQAVKNWLVQKGIASNRIKTVGKGEKEPVADNTTAEGRAANRRIEFYVE